MKYQNYTKKSQKLNIKQILRISFLFCLFIFIPFQSVFSAQIVADDIYKISESNGIATAICKAIDIGTTLMVPLFAIMFTILGFGAYQGNLKWSVFVTFTLGMAAFKAAGTIAELFMPDMGLRYGCKCAIEKQIRDVNGKITRYATGLNYDCTEGTNDYDEEYG